MSDLKFDGKTVVSMAKDMYRTDNPSLLQLQTVMDMTVPVNYLLNFHKVKGHPVTYSIPNMDSEYARNMRNWQMAILNDQSQDKRIMKSRQLGFSEVGVSELLWFCDTHSFDNVSALYTFPKTCGAL